MVDLYKEIERLKTENQNLKARMFNDEQLLRQLKTENDKLRTELQSMKGQLELLKEQRS